MKNIYFRDGILIYYGNPAGYLSEGKVVLDSIFDKEEIIDFLSEKEKLAVEIRSGVYDRLSRGWWSCSDRKAMISSLSKMESSTTFPSDR